MLAVGLFFAACSGGGAKSEEKAGAETKAEAKEERREGGEVELSEESLKAAKIETAEAVEQAAGETLRVTGSVETNQQLTQ